MRRVARRSTEALLVGSASIAALARASARVSAVPPQGRLTRGVDTGSLRTPTLPSVRRRLLPTGPEEGSAEVVSGAHPTEEVETKGVEEEAEESGEDDEEEEDAAEEEAGPEPKAEAEADVEEEEVEEA